MKKPYFPWIILAVCILTFALSFLALCQVPMDLERVKAEVETSIQTDAAMLHASNIVHESVRKAQP